VRSWDLNSLETPGGSRSPVVLQSQDEARAVLIGLEPGQELGEHEVKENAFVLVVSGNARISAGAESHEAGAGNLFFFEPGERHAVQSDGGARLLLFLAPWPGEGHYRGQEKASI